MKIAFITQPKDEVYPTFGGYSSISIVSYQLALRLARTGHEVIIYGTRGQAQPTMERDEEGILFRRISIGPEDLFLKPLRLLDRLGAFRNPKRPFFGSYLYYPGYALQIAWDLKKRQPDVIHIHNYSQYVPLIRVLNPNAKLVLHMHCEWLSQLDRSIIGNRLEKTNLVIGCSDYITNKVRLRFPKLADRCQTLFNGVNLAQFTGNSIGYAVEQDGPKRLLFIGRVSPEKGVHVLLDAFQKVLIHYPKAYLEIAGSIGTTPKEFIVSLSDEDTRRKLATFYQGDDDYFNQLKNRLPLNVWEHISFLGFLSQSQLVDHYRKADVLINPSLSEAFGMSLVEAMALKTPVVASRVGGMVDIVEDGKTGILVNVDDPDELADGIILILSNPKLSEAMGEAGRQRVLDLFSWERVTDKLISYYQSL